ncbi:MAG: YggT family protein [Thermodesulfobacteriota bacterium]
MFVISNFVFALAEIINLVLGAYMWIVIGRAVISWVNADPYNPIVRFVYEITEPLLTRIRRWLPFGGGIDFSPLILIIAITFIRRIVVLNLQDFARAIG